MKSSASTRQKKLLRDINSRWYAYLNSKLDKKHREKLIVAAVPLVQEFGNLIARQYSMTDFEDELISKGYVLAIELIDQRRTGRLSKGRNFGTFMRFKMFRSMRNWALLEKTRRKRWVTVQIQTFDVEDWRDV